MDLWASIQVNCNCDGEVMKKVLCFLVVLFGICTGGGFVVSGFEKKKGKAGWVKDHKPCGVYEKHMKRPLDFALSLFALLLLWPLILIIALLVKKKLGSPVMFVQERPGLGGKIFKIYKFRTMTNERDEDGNLLPDEKRLTKFGGWLRRVSGDEFPEMINVLKGDMSLVGPRPLLPEYLDRYSKEQAHRHDVRPGLTGYAQTEGRNLCEWDEKFKKDVEYVNRITFFGDIKILIKTVLIVLKREGISSETSVTMEEFTGNGSK